MRRPDLAKSTFALSVATAVFAYGVLVGRQQLFPWGIIQSGLDAVGQVLNELDTITGVRPGLFTWPARHEGSGVTVLSHSRASPGLTLIAGFFERSNELRLIRLDGTIVHRWPVRYSEIFPDPQHVLPRSERPVTDWNVDLHGALALPDGGIVFNFEYAGMVKLDRCGNVEWTLPRMTHHSIAPARGGGFWVGGRRYVDGPSQLRPLAAPYHEDTLLRVSASGEVLREISVPRLFFENGLEALLLATGNFLVTDLDDEEIVHLNDIEELSPELADHFPDFVPGDLALSLRHHNLIMVVDPVSERVKWHQTGPWIRQHDPDFTRRGTISVFNNNTDDAHGALHGGSNIMEVDPTSGAVTVTYGAAPDERMYTEIRGKHQLLPNGNLLVVEYEAGRVFEVATDGEVVWEFINRYDEDHIALLSDAIRYSETYFEVEDWSCP